MLSESATNAEKGTDRIHTYSSRACEPNIAAGATYSRLDINMSGGEYTYHSNCEQEFGTTFRTCRLNDENSRESRITASYKDGQARSRTASEFTHLRRKAYSGIRSSGAGQRRHYPQDNLSNTKLTLL